MTALPVRLRLTCWYCLMFATAGLFLGLTSWWMLRHTLDATIKQDLQERVDDIREQLSQIDAHTNLREAQQRFQVIYQARDDGKWLQVVDQEGRTVFRSPRLTALNHPTELPQSIPSAGALVELQLDAAHPVRFFSQNVHVRGRSFRIDTGISMTKPHALLHSFGLDLLLLTPLLVVLSALGGHFMSRKALAPVSLIALEARRITDRNLTNRLPVPAGNDEISHLSVTLNRMLARIDSGFRSVREFTANASHELRTPLARLRAEVEIALLRPRSASEYRQAMERVHRDALDMTCLVENLLSLARVDAGREVTHLSSIDLASMIDDTIHEWAPIADRLGIQLRIRKPAHGGSLAVLGDRLSLLRLLRILMDNACKFTPADGSITCSATEEEDGIALAVEDTGIGIAAEEHVRIFERFYRAPADALRSAAGAGLGLSLAAWIAEQHHTHIAVESAPGRGARFSILLHTVARGSLQAPYTTQDSVATHPISR